MTAAFLGERDEALARLRWLDQHRTAAGSLPEKVLSSGQPASVSPLAWTAAVVVITAHRLAS
jgi:GH15 family glucan-1,4-alpha-glucosidase